MEGQGFVMSTSEDIVSRIFVIFFFLFFVTFSLTSRLTSEYVTSLAFHDLILEDVTGNETNLTLYTSRGYILPVDVRSYAEDGGGNYVAA